MVFGYRGRLLGVCLGPAGDAGGSRLSRRDEEWAAWLRVVLSPVGGYLPSNGAALVAPGPLKKGVDQKIDSKNGKTKEYYEAHRFHARTSEVLPPLETGSRGGL